MKTLLATAAFAALIAAPALAQTTRAPAQYQRSYGRSDIPHAASPYSVYDGNNYLGADPDPNVRLELRRDFQHRDF